MPSSMTTTTGTSTIKRTHIQQLIDAWNGTTSVPLILNGVGNDATSLTIKSNGVNPPMKIVDSAGATIFSIGTTGVISPNNSTTAGTVSLGTTAPTTTPTSTGFYYGATTSSVASANVSVATYSPMRWTSSNSYAGGAIPTTQISQTLETYNMAAGYLAILLRPTPSAVSDSTTAGLYLVLRANANVSGTTISRDYNLQAVADGFPTAGIGDANVVGSLNITTDLNNATAVPIAKFKSRGFFTGIYSPPVTWLNGDTSVQDPQTTVTSGTETIYDTKIITLTNNSSTSVALAGVSSPLTAGATYPTPALPVNQPRGSLPVFRSDITGTSGAYTFTGSWGRLPASQTQGLVLQTDTSAPVLNPYGMKWGLPTSALTGMHREVIYPAQMTAVHRVTGAVATQVNAAVYAPTSATQIGIPGETAQKGEWRFPKGSPGIQNVNAVTPASSGSLTIGDVYQVVTLGAQTNLEWLTLAGYKGFVDAAGTARAADYGTGNAYLGVPIPPTFVVNSGFTAAMTGIGTGSGTVERSPQAGVFCSVPIPMGWKTGPIRTRLYFYTAAASSGIKWGVLFGQQNLSVNSATTSNKAFPVMSLGADITSDSTAAPYALRIAEFSNTLVDLNGVAVNGNALTPTYAGILDFMITRYAAQDAVAQTACLQMVVVEFGI